MYRFPTVLRARAPPNLVKSSSTIDSSGVIAERRSTVVIIIIYSPLETRAIRSDRVNRNEHIRTNIIGFIIDRAD